MVRTLADPGLDESERKTVDDVERYGLHVIIIPSEEGMPGWAFSIGLHHNFGHPELVVFGLKPEIAHWLLNEVARRISDGERFAPGDEADGLLEGVRCTFREVRPRWYHPFLGWMNWFYDGEEIPVLQCIWPDHDQRYPWDAAFRADWVKTQPLLFHEDPVEARATELLASLDLWPPRADA